MIFLACVAFCLLLGSVADWGIAQLVYSPQSMFARIGEAYGQLPAEITLAACGVMLVRCARAGESGPLPAKVLLGIGVVLVLGAIVCDVIRAGKVFDTSILTRALISTVIIGVFSLVAFVLVRKADPHVLLRYALFCIVVMLVQLVGVNAVLKNIWQRPRPRILAANPDLAFQPWWQLVCPDRSEYLAAGVIADGFKSFPSGHTANAAVALLLATLPLVVPSLERFQTPLFVAGVVVTVVVASARMVAGAHFLSDVSMGCAVTILTALVCSLLFFRKL